MSRCPQFCGDVGGQGQGLAHRLGHLEGLHGGGRDHPVVGADDLEVELGADPHGLCVDQLLDDEGAQTFPTTVDTGYRVNMQICRETSGAFNAEFSRQFRHRRTSEPERGAMLGFPARGPMQVIQAVAAIAVLADGGGKRKNRCAWADGLDLTADPAPSSNGLSLRMPSTH